MSQDIGNTARLESGGVESPPGDHSCCRSRPWVRQTARRYQVSPGWVSRLIARYPTEGEAAFEPRSRRPHSKPTAIPAATAELITKLRRDLTRQGLDAGPHTIAWHLIQQHQQTVSRSLQALIARLPV
jgi:Homeodomain-like domain